MISPKSKVLIQQIGQKDDREEVTDIENLESTKIAIKKQNKPNLSARLSKCIVCKKMCQYRCPNCSKNYCSISHFRSHNLFCSEKFFEKQVTDTLKGIKVKDKNQKEKVVQMMRENAEKMQDLFMNGAQLTQQRLQELLKDIQEGKQAKLSPKEEIIFQKYLNNAMKQENMTQIQGAQGQRQGLGFLQLPFWEIEDGLGIYLQKQVQIEQYGESEYPHIIAYRQFAKKRLNELQLVHHQQIASKQQIKKNPRKQILTHIFQIIHTFVMLYRVHDGEQDQFITVFVKSYSSKQNEQLLRVDNVCLESMLSCMEVELMANIEIEDRKSLNLWIRQYWPIIVKDLRKIFANKYLVLQTLMRIVDIISLESSKLNAKNKQQAKIHKIIQQKTYQQKELSKLQKMGLKLKKKCQFLLFSTLFHFDQGKWSQIFQVYCDLESNMYEKLGKQKKMFDEVKQLQKQGILRPKK